MEKNIITQIHIIIDHSPERMNLFEMLVHFMHVCFAMVMVHELYVQDWRNPECVCVGMFPISEHITHTKYVCICVRCPIACP